MSSNATTVATKAPAGFLQILEQFKPEIVRALPAHLKADRMIRIAQTEFRKNPKLADCDPRTVFGAVIMSSQLGLEPGVLGQSYLVPYYNKKRKVLECQLIPGWQGLNDLVSRSGRATSWTGAVYRGDDFDYALGDRPFITHRPGEDVDQDPNNLLYVYAVGRVKGAEWPVIEVWSASKVERHRDKYNQVGDSHYSYGNFEMYARKVPLLQVIKYMPKSVEMQRAADLEFSAQRGAQMIDITNASDNSWLPPPEDESNEGDSGSRAASMKNRLRGGAGTQGASGSDPLEAASIKAIKESGDLKALEDAWKQIVADYALKKLQVPLPVEAARDDHKATLEQI